MIHQLYAPTLGLLTDLYQITMAYGYWKSQVHTTQSTFQLFFRKAPFGGEYAVCAGVETAIELIEQFSFSESDLTYLQEQLGNDGQPLFEEDFLEYLATLSMDVDIDAIPEGTAVLAHEPILRITGNVVQCQLLETALLTCINFQTLIATKAHHVCRAAQDDTVLEFGLRRAQGFDGGLSAARAAYIGGVHATSNVLAGKLLGIPIKGTHAHAWVMMFDTEREAFEQYAKAMPNNCVFLVDTYDTLTGVQTAIEVGHALRAQGHEMLGIRLDSGELATLSQQARTLLDAGGFPNAKIVASDSLNEHRIRELKAQGAEIDIWGVGTNLVTAQDQPALGGVYKLSAQKHPTEEHWTPKIKLSNSPIKTSNPGRLQVYRCLDATGNWVGDFMGDVEEAFLDATGSVLPNTTIHSLGDQSMELNTVVSITPLLKPQLRLGRRVSQSESIDTMRSRSIEVQCPTYNLPHLTQATWETKESLIAKYRPPVA